MLLIPFEQLSTEALQGLVEEFVTRDGTDYGVQEAETEEKLHQVMRQLRSGDVLIVFDQDSEQASLVSKESLAQ